MDLQKSSTASLRIPLWLILIVPSVTVIIGISTLINLLSYQNSQSAINTITAQLMDEIDARIELHLTGFFDVPAIINRTHEHTIRSGLLDLSDTEAVQRYLWETIQDFETVSSTYIGNPQGGLINSGREGQDGSLYLMFTQDFTSGKLYKYATNSSGIPVNLLFSVDHFDARTRPWYQGAVDNQASFRTDPYVLSTGQDLAIASSLPIYADNGELLGVASVDIFLSQISDYLSTLEIGKTGQVYIIDGNGRLIASSQDSTFIKLNDEIGWEQLPAVESDNPVIARTSQFLADEFGGVAQLSSEHLSLTIVDEPHYLQVTRYNNELDLDWFVVSVIPENVFLAEIQASNRSTFFLIIVTSLIAVVVGALMALRVTHAITRLSVTAGNYEKGDWSQQASHSHIREINQVGQALSSMAHKLHEMLATLEERVQQRTNELAESESRYRAIVEDQTDLICRFLPDTTLTYVNRAYAAFFGSTPEEMLGKQYIQFLPEPDQIAAQKHLAQMNKEKPMAIMEHSVITPGGELRWMQWVDTALYDEQGHFIEFQSVGRDITSHKQLETNLHKSLQHELDLNELKTHFISTVSHEFRTPMALILNSSQFLQHYSEKIDVEKKDFHLYRINEQIERMVEILEGVLMINRAEQGKLQIEPDHFDLQQLCQTAINEIRTITPRTISFDLKTSGDCTRVYADRKLVRLIVSNLISNATKYARDNGHVWVNLICTSNKVKLSVKDDGIGMSKETQAHIFDPFYRADHSGSIEGIGLGLSIVKQCVELHQGTISFVSARDEGTEFMVEFPQADC